MAMFNYGNFTAVPKRGWIHHPKSFNWHISRCLQSKDWSEKIETKRRDAIIFHKKKLLNTKKFRVSDFQSSWMFVKFALLLLFNVFDCVCKVFEKKVIVSCINFLSKWLHIFSLFSPYTLIFMQKLANFFDSLQKCRKLTILWKVLPHCEKKVIGSWWNLDGHIFCKKLLLYFSARTGLQWKYIFWSNMIFAILISFEYFSPSSSVQVKKP